MDLFFAVSNPSGSKHIGILLAEFNLFGSTRMAFICQYSIPCLPSLSTLITDDDAVDCTVLRNYL